MPEPQLRFSRDVSVEGSTLVYAFEGWTDSGFAASLALAYLNKQASAEVFAEFAPDGLFDYRSRRPVFSVSNGVSQGLTWPTISLSEGRLGGSHTLVSLSGSEPDLNWQAFSKLVAEAVERLGISIAIGIGAIPAPVPHTKSPPIIATSPDPELVARVGALQGAAQVPAGVQLALEAAIAERGIASMSIWARVPHYVSQMTWPHASVALIETLERLVGFELDLRELTQSASEAKSKIDEAVRQNREAAEYVVQLERIFGDEEAQAQTSSLATDFGSVTGEQIASEIEQFLAGRSGEERPDSESEGPEA
jgi:predicted ATP-grasp superfamily ATP-dependent carboligase